MSPVMVRSNLLKYGLKLDRYNSVMLEEFCAMMDGRNYGVEETADAFAWFSHGWERAKLRLGHTPEQPW